MLITMVKMVEKANVGDGFKTKRFRRKINLIAKYFTG